MALIGVAGLSLKEKLVKHSRSHNFELIVTKLSRHVGSIKLQIKFGDELYMEPIGEAVPSLKDFFLSILEAETSILFASNMVK